MCCCVLCLFPLPDAMWTTKYLEWHGSIAPPFYLQEVRSGLWTLVSSWWKTQQSQSTASRSKMLTSMTKGPMSAQSSQTRNQNPRECISLFKVRPSQPCQWLYSATTNIKRCQTRWVLEQCCCFFFCNVDVHFYRWRIENPSRSCLDLTRLRSNQINLPSSVLGWCD